MKVLFYVAKEDLLEFLLFFGELYADLDWTYRLASKASRAVELIRHEEFALMIFDERLATPRFLDHIETERKKSVLVFLSDHQDFTKARIVFIERDRITRSLEQRASFFKEVLLQRENYPLILHKDLLQIPYRKILYLEKDGRYVLFHTRLGLFKKRATLKEVADSFLEHGFVRIHNSFVVNPLFISARKKNEVQIDHQIWLPLSRAHQKGLAALE